MKSFEQYQSNTLELNGILWVAENHTDMKPKYLVVSLKKDGAELHTLAIGIRTLKLIMEDFVVTVNTPGNLKTYILDEETDGFVKVNNHRIEKLTYEGVASSLGFNYAKDMSVELKLLFNKLHYVINNGDIRRMTLVTANPLRKNLTTTTIEKVMLNGKMSYVPHIKVAKSLIKTMDSVRLAEELKKAMLKLVEE